MAIRSSELPVVIEARCATWLLVDAWHVRSTRQKARTASSTILPSEAWVAQNPSSVSSSASAAKASASAAAPGAAG